MTLRQEKKEDPVFGQLRQFFLSLGEEREKCVKWRPAQTFPLFSFVAINCLVLNVDQGVLETSLILSVLLKFYLCKRFFGVLARADSLFCIVMISFVTAAGL